MILGNKLGTSLFGLAAVTALVAQPAIANPEVGKKASELTQYSNSASDLFTAYDPVDLEEFCDRYPYNSRCANRPRSTPEPEPSRRRRSRPTSDVNSGFAVTPEISTLGLGASVSYGVTPQLNGRLGINGFSVGVDVEDTDVTYDSDVNLFNISAAADYYPIRNSGFKVSAGLVFNDNNIDGTLNATDGTTVDLGDGNNFTVGTEFSSLDADVEFPNEIAPYIGIGWGNPVRPGSRWSFNVNLGVMFPGSPEVNIEANDVPAANQNDVNAAIAEEEAELEDELDNFDIYPVFSLGVSYQF